MHRAQQGKSLAQILPSLSPASLNPCSSLLQSGTSPRRDAEDRGCPCDRESAGSLIPTCFVGGAFASLSCQSSFAHTRVHTHTHVCAHTHRAAGDHGACAMPLGSEDQVRGVTQPLACHLHHGALASTCPHLPWGPVVPRSPGLALGGPGAVVSPRCPLVFVSGKQRHLGRTQGPRGVVSGWRPGK